MDAAEAIDANGFRHVFQGMFAHILEREVVGHASDRFFAHEVHSIEASSGSRWHYGASGSVVNVAARLRELAREGSILISAVSLEKISKDFVVEDMGNHSLKNIKNTVHVYRLMDELRV